MRMSKLLLAAGILLASTLAGLAYEFQPIGYESISMGGAGVACANGSMAGYYNPALLARPRYGAEFSISGGVGLREYKLAQKARDLKDMNLQDTITRMSDVITISGNAATIAANTAADRRNILTIQKIVKDLDGTSLTLNPTAAIGTQMGHFSIGVYVTSDAFARANYNSANSQLLFKDTNQYYNGQPATVYFMYDPGNPDTNIPETYTYNVIDNAGVSHALTNVTASSGVVVNYNPNLGSTQYTGTSIQYAVKEDTLHNNITTNGIVLTEIPLSTAYRFETPAGAFSVGASVKAMIGATYNNTMNIDSNVDDANQLLKDNSKVSQALGLDIGGLYEPAMLHGLTVGLVLKDLNSPKFATANGGPKITIKPMLRAGADLALAKSFDIAADLDLTKNTALDGHGSKYFGAGASWHPLSWFSLRAGMMNNTADDTLGNIATAGLGLGLKWLQLDIAAQASSKTTTIDGKKYPSYAKVNVALVSKW